MRRVQFMTIASSERTKVLSPRWLFTRAIAFFTTIILQGGLRQHAFARGDNDRLRTLQTDYIVNANRKMPRVYHFGSQGPGDVFSNHTSHSNRLIPVYTFGSKVSLTR